MCATCSLFTTVTRTINIYLRSATGRAPSPPPPPASSRKREKKRSKGGGEGGGGKRRRRHKITSCWLVGLSNVPASCYSLSQRQFVCLLVGCLTSQQQASVSQGRVCTDNFTCCHTDIEAADQTFHLTQSQYADTGPTSPSAYPITPGAWQGSQWSANF